MKKKQKGLCLISKSAGKGGEAVQAKRFEGDPDGLMRRLIRQYGASISRMCFLYLRDRHLAEDAVQDTFLKVFRHWSQFQGRSDEKTWIVRIAINVCKNYLRGSWWKRIDAEKALMNIPAGEAAHPADDTLVLEVMRLPPKYREAILLHYYQGLGIHEVAGALKLPESTVYTRLSRARDILKKKLGGWYHGE